MTITPEPPTSETAQAELRRSLIESADMSIPDHAVTISVGQDYCADEELESSMMAAQKAVKDQRGRSSREDVDNGYVITASFRSAMNSGDIMDALYSAMEKQKLWFSIEMKDSRTGQTMTQVRR